MSTEDNLNSDNLQRSLVRVSNPPGNYTAALQAARELNAVSANQTSTAITTLGALVKQVAPIVAIGTVAVGAVGIVAAGIAAAFNASRHMRNIQRREAGKNNTDDTAREIMSAKQVVIYRSVTVRLEILDRRDDLAGKRF